MGQRVLDALDTVLDLARIAAELLAERDGGRILKVRTARFHHVGELTGFGGEGVV